MWYDAQAVSLDVQKEAQKDISSLIKSMVSYAERPQARAICTHVTRLRLLCDACTNIDKVYSATILCSVHSLPDARFRGLTLVIERRESVSR